MTGWAWAGVLGLVAVVLGAVGVTAGPAATATGTPGQHQQLVGSDLDRASEAAR